LNHESAPGFLFEHDLFGKPVATFPDHALERQWQPVSRMMEIDRDRSDEGDRKQ
jgi:hypothetical protein